MTEQRTPDCVTADHPSLAGHFPGNPIVPGVVLLDRVLAAVEAHVGRPLVAVPNLKFLQPLRPDTAFVICWSLQGDSLRFRCESLQGSTTIIHVQGVLSFQSVAG